MTNSTKTNHGRRAILTETASLGFLVAAASSTALANPITLGKDQPSSRVTNDDGNVAGAWLAQADEAFFNSYLNSSFEFWNARGRARATLNNVQNFVAGKSKTALRAFSLEFLILESTLSLPTDSSYVTHSKLGTFELFVVPAKNAKGDRLLLATFARL
jgi:hypothetical protein